VTGFDELLQNEERKCIAAWTVVTVRNSIIWADTYKLITNDYNN